MAWYRIYLISSADRILAAENIDAASDEAAIDQARLALAASREAGFEVWQGSRFVHKEAPAAA